MQASERLHKLNMKYKALEIEESVFVVNKQDMIEKKLRVSADIRETLCLIEECLLLLQKDFSFLHTIFIVKDHTVSPLNLQ